MRERIIGGEDQHYEIVTAEVMEYITNPSDSTNCPAGGTVTYGYIGANATCTVTNHVVVNLQIGKTPGSSIQSLYLR